MHTPFRNAKELVNSVPDIGSHNKKSYIGKIEEYFKDLEEQEILALEDAEWELDMLDIQNMYSLKTTDFLIKPKDLNSDQLKIYSQVISGEDRFHLISGGPGTGKSYLIRALSHGLRALHKETAVTASTGVAAFLI